MRRDHLLKIPAGKGTGAHAKSEKAEYGDGFTKTNLYNFTEFDKAFPEIFHPASGKFDIRFSWTHYRFSVRR